MNILHYVTKKEQVSPQLKKLKATCDAEAEKTAPSGGDEATGYSPGLDKEEIKQRLTPAEFRITQHRGTEKPFSGKYNTWKEEGVFNCVVCGAPLFSSDTKFDSRSGWPAFSDVLAKDRVQLFEENLGGLQRMEVKCRTCKAHLGHVFDDGPKPTGLRYCVNSCCLDFRKHTTV